MTQEWYDFLSWWDDGYSDVSDKPETTESEEAA